MIAIILAATQRFETHGLDEHLPIPLFPLADRPLLHHIVDFLVAAGVRRVEFVLGHLPEKIETYLGDGARWGVSFGFHLLQSTSDPMNLVQAIAAGLDDDIVLGRGDSLPEFQLQPAAEPTIVVNTASVWTGWAVLPRGVRYFTQLGAYAAGARVDEGRVFKRVTVARELSFGSVQDLLRSQEDFLTGAFAGAEISERQIRPGIWVARTVSLHPTAELKAPLYIGPNCKIEMGVCIGPSVVIGEGCIVDQLSLVANSLIAPRTYIGQGLELDHAIVDRNRLVNTKLGTAILISESFLLSGLSRQKRPRVFHRLASRLSALAIFVSLLPISVLTLGFLLLSRQGKLVWEKAVAIPTADDPHIWREYRYLRLRLRRSTISGWWTCFVAEVWPGLISVMRGDLFLVGVKPRSRQEVDRLSTDWRSLHLSSKAGLITEAFVTFGRAPDEDELYTAEAYYNAVQSIGHDLKLIRLYLFRLLTSNERGIADGCAEDSTAATSLENFVGR